MLSAKGEMVFASAVVCSRAMLCGVAVWRCGNDDVVAVTVLGGLCPPLLRKRLFRRVWSRDGEGRYKVFTTFFRSCVLSKKSGCFFVPFCVFFLCSAHVRSHLEKKKMMCFFKKEGKYQKSIPPLSVYIISTTL